MSITTLSPNNSGINCYNVPANNLPNDITTTRVRSLNTVSVTTGSSSSVDPSTLNVTPGTYTGNVLIIGVSYGSLGSPAINAGVSEVAGGSNVYLNLANLYLTFQSSIC